MLREQREKDNEFILEIVFQSLTCHFLIQFQEYCIEIVDVSVSFTKGSNGSSTTYSEGSLGTWCCDFTFLHVGLLNDLAVNSHFCLFEALAS